MKQISASRQVESSIRSSFHLIIQNIVRQINIFFDNFLKCSVFRRYLSVFCKQRVIIIRGYVRFQFVIIIGTVHKPKISPSLKHIQIDMPLLKNIIQIFQMLFQIPCVMFTTPIVKPAHPKLHTHQGSISDFFLHHFKLHFPFGTKISCLQGAVYLSMLKSFVPRSVRCYQRNLAAVLYHQFF